MHLLPEDERGLQAALALAQAAVGLASPNPTVGCVLVRGGAVLGQGAHAFDHRDHAEIVALKQAAAAGYDVRGATACVTLEPCAHHGRTGPCAEALVRAGIRRCVAATVDPNPLVRGQGFAKLRAAGAEVVLADPASPLAQAARRLNEAFAFAVRYGRPFVTLKAALSVDGKLAPPPQGRTPGQPHWLTGAAARNDVQSLRHQADAILTGIGTVLADDPHLTDRTGLPRRRRLLRIVLDPRLRTPLSSALVRAAQDDLLVVGAKAAPQAAAENLRAAGAEVLLLDPPAPDGRGFDLDPLFGDLAARRINSVLLEGGSGVNGTFLQANRVDRIVLYFAEAELGTAAVPFASGQVSPFALQTDLTSLERTGFPNGSGEDVRIAGYLHDPWAGMEAGAAAL